MQNCPIPAPTLITCGTYDACPLRCQSPVRKKLFRDTSVYKEPYKAGRKVTCTKVINGKTHRHCNRCQTWKIENKVNFENSSRDKTKFQGPCRPCKKEYKVERRKLKAMEEAS